MVKIIDSRDSGKTRKLLTDCCVDPNALLVCAHPNRVNEKCSAYGLPYVEAIGYEEFVKAVNEKDSMLNGKNIYIDELERFTESFTKLAGYTLSLD